MLMDRLSHGQELLTEVQSWYLPDRKESSDGNDVDSSDC